MISTLISVIAPVAILIAAGYAAVKFKLFPFEGVKFLMGYVQNFAVPLLLFDAVRKLDFSAQSPFELWGIYYIPALLVFLLGIVYGRKIGRGPQASVVLGFNALFANSVFIGLAICERAFGAESLSVNYLIIAIHSPFGYIVGAISMQIANPDRQSMVDVIKNIWNELTHNALIIGILLGAIANFTNLEFPTVIEDTISMPIRAALPVALFGIGGVLTNLHLKGALPAVFGITFVRMIAHPLLILLIGTFIFSPSAQELKTLVLMASVPTGINGFIFATLYKREEDTAASIVFFSTIMAIIVLPFWLVVISLL